MITSSLIWLFAVPPAYDRNLRRTLGCAVARKPELDAAASYHDDLRHAGLARRAAGRIHHAHRQPAEKH
jgi:hypothetical protein